MVEYISQSPVIPVVIAGLVVIIVLLQCLTKKRFLKFRFVFSCIVAFGAVMFLVFFKEIQSANDEFFMILTYIGLILVEVLSMVILFSTIDFSMAREKFQKALTTSLNENKFFVLLDKKDRVKSISSCLLKNLEISEENALYKNFFDVVEIKYRIIGLNSEECLKEDVKKFYTHYDKKVQDGEKKTLELNLQNDDGSEAAFYFTEEVIFNHGKYSGRILLGDMKDRDSLVGMEKELTEAQEELELIRSRFTTLLYKTNDGIFFNNMTDESIWVNDVIVEKLCLNGNSMSQAEFFSNMHPDDIALYQNILKSSRSLDYEATYRYNTGNNYVYVKEVGQRIALNGTVEYCGIMNVIDDYHFEKTDTILDTLGTEPELLNRYKQLINEENNVFLVVYFKIASIPEINEKFGRAIGNMMLGEYISFFKKSYVTSGNIYRTSGLEFVALITNFNRMEALSSALKNNEKILHISATYANEKISTDVFMGLSYSADTGNKKETINQAKDALRIASNPQFKSSYAFYKDVK
ncbi:MAG: diguanylate cyclase [Acholeplasmatales bacterium]|nr:diguanylate cyclase [Acholeplasmatales bacterium]